MKKITTLIALSALTVFYTGCDEGVFERNDGLVHRYTPELTALERNMLEFLNHPLTTIEVLDDEVGLDKRAAEHLVAHRNGPDGLVDTDDDDLFNSIEEVDGVFWVGQTTLERLADWIESEAWSMAPHHTLGVYDGVHFTVAEGHRTVELANEASLPELRDIIALGQTSSDLIFKLRPFATMAELSKVYGVDGAALTKLKSAALHWGPAECQEAPRLDDLTALNDDFQQGVYLVCSALSADGSCPEPGSVSAAEMVESEFGFPKRVDECAWVAEEFCGRRVESNDCCTVMSLSQNCSH
jgi:hypothetical protein